MNKSLNNGQPAFSSNTKSLFSLTGKNASLIPLEIDEIPDAVEIGWTWLSESAQRTGINHPSSRLEIYQDPPSSKAIPNMSTPL
jgi:hypothetical protein